MAISSGLYASNGSWRVTVISNTSSSSYAGLYASDGSYNVISATGTNWVGVYHPNGGYWVTNVSSNVLNLFAADGSYNVTTTSSPSNAAHSITVVAGSFVTITGSQVNVAVFQGY